MPGHDQSLEINLKTKNVLSNWMTSGDGAGRAGAGAGHSCSVPDLLVDGAGHLSDLRPEEAVAGQQPNAERAGQRSGQLPHVSEAV